MSPLRGAAPRGAPLTISVWLCVLAGALALGSPTQALTSHEYESQTAVLPEGPVREPKAMTFFAGDLYTAENLDGQGGGFNFRTDQLVPVGSAPVKYEFASKLSQKPEYLNPYSGIAFGTSTGETEMYVGEEDDLDSFATGLCGTLECATLQEKWTGAHTPGGSFEEIGGVAVDSSTSSGSGDVFVLDTARHAVDVFDPEAGGKEPAQVKTQITGISPSEPFGRPEHLAVSGFNGDVVVEDSTGGQSTADLFEPQGTGEYAYVGQLEPSAGEFAGGIVAVAVDGGSAAEPGNDATSDDGDIYVATPSTIYEFGPEGSFRGEITGEATPEHEWSANGAGTQDVESIAVDPVFHRVLVGVFSDYRQKGTVDVFGPDAVVPDVMTEPVSNVQTESSNVQAEPETDLWNAQLNGTVNPDQAGAGTCDFEWGTTTELGRVATCSAPVGDGAADVAVQATLRELEPDTTYYYRLQATNANGFNAGEASQDQQFTTPGPGMHGDAPADVTAESGTLTATLSPHNAPTTYYFQYGTTADYGADAPVLSDGAENGGTLGSGEGDIEVSQHIQGLQADTVYHFRVVAVSEIGGSLEAFASPDQTFTTQHSETSQGLPDGRQWEMVTPPQKEGADFIAIGLQSPIQASTNGNAMMDVAGSPTEAEPLGYANLVSVLSTRGSDGWSSQDIALPHDAATGLLVGEGLEFRFFSEDLSLGIAQPFGSFVALSPQATEATAYLRSNYLNGDVSDHCESSYKSASSCFQPLVTAANTPPGTVFAEKSGPPFFLGATPDLGHIVLESSASLTPGSGEGEGLYEWTAGKLTFIGDGKLGDGNNAARHAISDDGSRVIFEGTSEGLEGLLLRDAVKQETVQLDAPQGGGKSLKPQFMDASSDGSRIFFLDSGGLTAEASEGGADLYEYNPSAPVGSRLSDLTIDRRLHENAEVAEVLGASEDGSYVYFAAAGVLAPGAHPAGPGENLYVRHDGATTLIATLSGEDSPDWSTGLQTLTARVSPDGNWLAFMSNRDLTGYDTNDAVSGRPDEEVYLYEAGTSHLVCGSCNPTGARPVGVEYKNLEGQLVGSEDPGTFNGSTWVAANIPGWTPYRAGAALYQSRYLSDSGRLFFNSNDALVPRDVDGTEDVYEYEPEGVGSCTQSGETFDIHADGCVGLISSGSSSEESAFLDASETGDDVFFLTKAQLAPQDFDTALDVYDAHMCSAQAPCFPASPVVPPACATGDACEPAPTPQPPIFGSPSSATFSGAGNIVSPKVAPAVTPKTLTRAQKLARALSACRKRKRPKQRAACERKARSQYGVKKSTRAKAKRTKAKRGRR